MELRQVLRIFFFFFFIPFRFSFAAQLLIAATIFSREPAYNFVRANDECTQTDLLSAPGYRHRLQPHPGEAGPEQTRHKSSVRLAGAASDAQG